MSKNVYKRNLGPDRKEFANFAKELQIGLEHIERAKKILFKCPTLWTFYRDNGNHAIVLPKNTENLEKVLSQVKEVLE